MALGKIYAKTSSDIVNSLTDKMLIINRGSAYQVPFYNNSGNYNEIKFSMLVSFTDSDNDDISGTYNTFNNPVTGTSKETFSYIGFTTNDGVTGVPTTNGVDFIGIRYNMFITAVNSSGNSNIKNNLISDSTIFQNISTYRGGTSSSRIGENGKFGYYATSDTTTLCASYYPNAINLKDQPPKWKVFGLPHRWGGNYDYFLYVGMGIEVIDKGLSTQKLRLKLYQSFGPTTDITNSAGVQAWTDSSMYGSIPGPAPNKVNLPNLRYGSNVDDYLAEYQDIPWNKDGAALDLPINFFWYNSLPDLRPRISTLHGRVLS
jgi:hypothetical protein